MSMLKSIRNVTVVLLIVKVIGFIKQAVIAAYFGATGATDIYMLVSELVDSLGEVLFSSISVTFLTMYANVMANETVKAKRQFASNVVIYGTPIVLLLSLIVFLFSGFWAKLLAPGYVGKELLTVAKYLRILSIGMTTMFISALCRAILDAEKHFIPSKLEGLIKSAITIGLCVICAKKFGVDVLIWSVLAYYIVADIYLIYNVYKRTDVRLIKPTKADPRLKKLLLLSVPLFISNGSVYLHNIVDKAVGSTLAEGSISVLSYSNYITNTIHSLIIGSICTVLLSYFSTYVAEKKIGELTNKLENCIRILIVVMGFFFVLIFATSEEIVQVLYGRGAFGQEAIDMTSKIFIIYGAGLIFIGIRDVLIRTHYAFQQNKIAMINGILGMFANIVLSIALAKFIGVYGIAIATVIAYLLIMTLSIFTARKFIEKIDKKRMLILSIQILLIITIGTAISMIISPILAGANVVIRGGIKAFVVTALYALCLYLFKNKEIMQGINILKEKLGR